jgi:hypothetical protein
MAKMASLHAEQYEIPICHWCGDNYDVCRDADECPASSSR